MMVKFTIVGSQMLKKVENGFHRFELNLYQSKDQEILNWNTPVYWDANDGS